MLTAKDIMTAEIVMISGSATIAEAVKLMKFKQVHSLIVERRHNADAYGIITSADISNKVVAYGKDANKIKIYEVMTKPCVVINPDLAVEYVARLLAQTGVDHAPVIQGEILGIISTTDITTRGDFIENPRVPLLERSLQAEIAHARAISAAKGPYSNAGKEAWQTVSALEAELAFCKGIAPEQTALEQYEGDAPVPEPLYATVK